MNNRWRNGFSKSYKMSVVNENVEQIKTVLVTGGTGAIGSAIVRAIVAKSTTSSTRCWNVVANYTQDKQRAQQLQSETGCGLHRADIADENETRAMFSEIENLFAVVHCAGVSHNNLLMRQTPEEWRETMRVNSDGAFLVTRESLKALPRNGRLILLASRVGERGNAGQSAYAASKAAVIALTKCAAREAGKSGVCVNAICPGFVLSDLTQSLPDKVLQNFRAQSVFGEFGGGGEAVASAVLWLLSDAAREVSGQIIHCDSRVS